MNAIRIVDFHAGGAGTGRRYTSIQKLKYIKDLYLKGELSKDVFVDTYIAIHKSEVKKETEPVYAAHLVEEQRTHALFEIKMMDKRGLKCCYRH
ncbi:hypothetical protein AGMMS50268_17140 [Spirochaetia bacterium]|nr:hypothetical protein AGMMS50268_17140 [Spirochaetia bacterium]